jgi:E3 ubiquitin-protein ligase HERC3
MFHIRGNISNSQPNSFIFGFISFRRNGIIYHDVNAYVKCWGRNKFGRLGIGSTTQMGDNQGEMAQLIGINLGTGRTATAIAAGQEHTCAILDNASVKCWGSNYYGQLGIDNNDTKGDAAGEMGDNLNAIDL